MNAVIVKEKKRITTRWEWLMDCLGPRTFDVEGSSLSRRSQFQSAVSVIPSIVRTVREGNLLICSIGTVAFRAFGPSQPFVFTVSTAIGAFPALPLFVKYI